MKIWAKSLAQLYSAFSDGILVIRQNGEQITAEKILIQ
jgi:hypothetical protein